MHSAIFSFSHARAVLTIALLNNGILSEEALAYAKLKLKSLTEAPKNCQKLSVQNITIASLANIIDKAPTAMSKESNKNAFYYRRRQFCQCENSAVAEIAITRAGFCDLETSRYLFARTLGQNTVLHHRRRWIALAGERFHFLVGSQRREGVTQCIPRDMQNIRKIVTNTDLLDKG